MNRADVVTAAVEHAIPASRLLLFAELAVAGTSRSELAAVISSYRPSEVVTGAARFVADDDGITGTGLLDDREMSVSWDDLTGYLMAVITSEYVEDLTAVHRPSLGGAASADRRLAELRARLAYDTVTAAGLIQPSLFTGILTERTLIDGPGDDGGFTGRVTLDPVDDNAVACRVNGQSVVMVSAAAEVHHVVVRVHDGPAADGAPFGHRVGFIAPVRHVPPGESAAPLPATFAQRVGAEVLNENPTGARWAVQVDGFDVAIIEVSNAMAPTVRAAIYDNDPAQPFQRYEGHCTVPGTSPPRPRDVGAAANRLAHLRRPPSPGIGR